MSKIKWTKLIIPAITLIGTGCDIAVSFMKKGETKRETQETIRKLVKEELENQLSKFPNTNN